MMNSRPRQLAALVLLAFATMVAVPSAGQAATIKACQNKKNGKLRIAKKCKKSEKRITWNTNGPKGDQGPAGANGAAGTPGTNGTPGSPGAAGQPQNVRKFQVSQPSGNGPTLPVFSVDGVDYGFRCQFAAIANVARLTATGPSGSSYAQAALARPSGINSLDGDPESALTLGTLDGTEEVIASHTTLAESEGSVQQNGVWTVTVEGPSATTFIFMKMVAAATCSAQGVSYTIPNS